MKTIIDFSRYKAQRVHHLIRRQLDGGLVKEPRWLSVVSAYPPLSRPVAIPSQDPSRVQQVDLNLAGRYCKNLQTTKWRKLARKGGKRWNEAVKEAVRVLPIPGDVVFPEDKLREKFHEAYPVERMRPIVLHNVERKQVLDGEDFVRYQQQLMEREENPLSEEAAFEEASKKFSEDRSKSELEQSIFAERARSLGAARMEIVDGDLRLEDAETTFTATELWQKNERDAFAELYEARRQQALQREQNKQASL
jgi:hypothetical protein